MLASISDNVLASSEGIPRAREANQAVPKLLIAGPRAYPAFVGIQSDIRAIVFWYLVDVRRCHAVWRWRRIGRGESRKLAARRLARTERGGTARRIGYRRRRTGISTAQRTGICGNDDSRQKRCSQTDGFTNSGHIVPLTFLFPLRCERVPCDPLRCIITIFYSNCA